MIGLLLFFCAVGAIIRYLFSKVNSRAALPVGTLLVNLVGAFLIGYLYKHINNKELYTILATGFCGGLTTFSTFNAELLALISDGKKFFTYLILTYLAGFFALILGIFI